MDCFCINLFSAVFKLEFSAQTKAFSWEKVGRRKPSRMRVRQEARCGKCP